MTNRLLGIIRKKALDLFKLNKGFLTEIMHLNPLQISSFFKCVNEGQMSCLIHLLYFIFLREIPIFKNSFKNLRNKDKNRIMRLFKNTDIEDVISDVEMMKKILFKLRYSFPELVKPILKRSDGM